MPKAARILGSALLADRVDGAAGIAPSPAGTRRRSGSHRALGMAVIAASVLGIASVAHAGPPTDDWSLEARDDDAVLVAQRFAKLKKRPLDAKQWRALLRALGKQRLAAKIERQYDRHPDDVALAILQARALLMLEKPAEAAAVLEAAEPSAGRLRRSVFDLRVDALVDAERGAAAAAALEAEVERLEREQPGAPSRSRRRELLDTAMRVSERAGLDDDALRFAEALAALDPKDRETQLALARAASAADAHDMADAAYQRAIEATRGAARPSLVAERAGALANARRYPAAAELLWGLLDGPNTGRREDRADWWRALEEAHRREGTTATLATRLEKWLDAAGGDRRSEAAAWRTLANAFTSLGRDPVPAWEAAVEANPRDVEARMGLIEALEAAGRTQDALARYRELSRSTPQDVARGLAMADRLVVNGERKRGLELADEIAAGAGRDADTLLALLDYFNEHDESDRALAVAERLVRLRPRDVDAHIALGEQLYQMGRPDQAIEQWNHLPKLIRPAHAGWARLAQLLSEHASTSRSSRLSGLAMTALERALDASPDDPQYLRLRALLEEERREHLAALATWQKVRAQATRPKDELIRAEARTRVVELLVSGVLRKQTSSLREAARREALQDLTTGATPQGREAALFLAELYTREQHYHEAVEVLLDLVEAFPQDGSARMDLARAQRRAGRIDDAMKSLQAVIDIDPKRRADALAELSELAYADGDRGQALDAALAAAGSGIDGGRALLRLGELHERSGDLDGAARAYEAALAAAPGDSRAMIRLADLDLRRGHTQRASERFREILSSGGPPEVMRAAAQRALDLAEITGSTSELLDLAIVRTQHSPEDDEARAFLLDVLDRTYERQVARWLGNEGAGPDARDPDRVAALRAPLVGALTRGTISNRLRAAQHLGQLAFPDTAVPLARLGVSLATPRNASRTVRDAYDETRVTAIEAAGRLDDPEARSWLEKAAQQSAPEPRLAAIWALASSDHAESFAAVRTGLGRYGDRENALACLGLARGIDGSARATDLAKVDRIAHDTAEPTVRAACAYAAASLTPDARLHRLAAQFEDKDPIVAAAAAWRMGVAAPEKLDDETLTALWKVYLGPRGLARDAGALALARHYGEAAAPAKARPLPTLGESHGWSAAVNRWLMDVVAAPAEPIPASVAAKEITLMRAAVRRLAAGTPAERAAAARVVGPCTAPASDPVRDALDDRGIGRPDPDAIHDDTPLCPGGLVVDATGARATVQ